jgi:hypothetical protein
MNADLNLTVHVDADEWAYLKRRTVYLETLLLSIVRDEADIREWISAEELAAMRLPGLPLSPASITRKATAGRWMRRRDRAGKGRYLYHLAYLPARAFDALLSRMLDVEDIEGDPLDVPAPVFAENAAPPWVLPLMRLMKGGGDLASAWRDLPAALPHGVALPTVEEAATILVRFGLAE